MACHRPNVPSDSITIWEDLRSPPHSKALQKTDQNEVRTRPNKILEAQGWRRTATGQIHLVSQGASTTVPQANLTVCLPAAQ